MSLSISRMGNPVRFSSNATEKTEKSSNTNPEGQETPEENKMNSYVDMLIGLASTYDPSSYFTSVNILPEKGYLFSDASEQETERKQISLFA